MAFRTSTVDPEIGRLIAHHRKRKGILQVELADATGICHAQVSRYERGHEYVSLARRQKIAEALGVDPVVFADPALVEVTPYERIFLEAFRRISTSAGRDQVMAQIESETEDSLMLSPPDLSGFDLDDLSANLLLLTQRQHRCLRQANDLVEIDGRPGIASEIDNLDRDVASAAEAHRLVSLLRRFAADEGHAQLAATDPRNQATPTPPAPRPGIFARTMALLGRGELGPALSSKKDAA